MDADKRGLELKRLTSMREKYAVVIEKGETSFGGCVPDLPGCIAVAATRNEVERLIAEAIGMHIEALLEQGNPVPHASSAVEYIEPATVA